jgi:uncharacterized membrane protein YraQ (UPF0718 family)/copper chaperone CopZ
MRIVLETLLESWNVLGQMAPYLLFGFLMAGLLSVWLSAGWLERHLGGWGMGPVWKAALFGVPLPLCSCGVIPVGTSLRRHGASPAATTSFLLSTPQTGVDSILVTYAMLGPLFAIYRPLLALITGLVGGGLVLLAPRPARGRPDAVDDAATAANTCPDDCCAPLPRSESRLLRALRYGFVTLPRDIGGALLVGVVVAGLLTALVPADYLAGAIGGGVLSVLIMMVLGVPIYVCATASVPIAAGLLHAGASPGAALAFLVAGPATNAATITTLWKVLGRRTTLLFLATVAAAALLRGLLLNRLMPLTGATVPALGGHGGGLEGSAWYSHLAAVLLLGMVGYSLAHRWRIVHARDREGPGQERVGEDEEPVLVLEVKGMDCSHCAETVGRALRACPGVEAVVVLLEQGRVRITGPEADPAGLVSAVAALGYAARPVKSINPRSPEP